MPTTVEKIVDRIVIDDKLVEVVYEKLVPYLFEILGGKDCERARNHGQGSQRNYGNRQSDR